ncbi:CDC45 [Cordylochernes scorpioides]|uniref:CDC45 n=1 Tax=Cordylochernes scorpioides TaxID=51811 RepID=A0ABY6KD00_9ARAC|nr:CDC45 [Cordylochernes scorpioides]UYV66721.1 CDC45 [Cordylochernes scorpioides]
MLGCWLYHFLDEGTRGTGHDNHELKSEFYQKVIKSNVLIFVNYDVDAICSTRILQYLLKCDNIEYTLIPVYDKDELIKSYQTYKDTFENIILINCGGNIDIVETFQPDEETKFYILDNHRPLDIYNIYNESQVCFLNQLEEEAPLPKYEELFREDLDEVDDESDLTPEVLEKRREIREWINKRHELLFAYQQFSYHGTPSSMIMFDLAWKMSRDNNELLWCAIIGLTDLYFHSKLDFVSYMSEVSKLQPHVVRHNQRLENSEVTVNSLKISYEKELRLFLYRHWTLMESLRHSIYTKCQLRLWSVKGDKKLKELLAEIGVPLSQAKQRFTSMELTYRSNIKSWLEDISEKYNLSEMLFASFNSQFGYKINLNAVDHTIILSTLLETSLKGVRFDQRFWDALDALSHLNEGALRKGMKHAFKRMTAIFSQIQVILDRKLIVSAGPFLYTVIQEGTPDLQYFSFPISLALLAHFLLQIYVSRSASQKLNHLPLVLAAPFEDSDHLLVVGVPPIAEESFRNFFGKAFEQVAQQANCGLHQPFFDLCMVKLCKADKSRFFDALISLLS